MDDSFLKQNSYHGSLTGTSIRKPELVQISILYSIAVALFLFLPPLIRPFKLNFYISGVFSELLLVLLPAVLLLVYCGYNLKSVLRLNKVGFMNIFITFWIMVFALPAVGVLNILNIWLVKLAFGRISTNDIPVASNWVALLLGILVIGGSAGLCEEIMFRGVIQRGFERFGITKAILITSLLFGFIHRDLQRLFGTAALGALIGFLVYRSNSIYTGMFAHFTNNSIAVFMGYLSYKIEKMAPKQGLEGIKKQSTDQIFSSFTSMPKAQLIAGLVFWGMILIGFTIALIALLHVYIQSTSLKLVPVRKERVEEKRNELLWLIPGLAMVGFIYLVQGMELSKMNLGVLSNIVKFLGLG